MYPGQKRDLNKDHAYQNEGQKSHFSRQVFADLHKDLLHGIATTNIDNLIRPMVAEEMDRVISKAAAQWRVPLEQTTGSPARKLHLQFRTNPKAESFTESKLEGEHGDTIRVMLMDTNTGQPVTTGPESTAKLEVVPLLGDFNNSDEQEWTAEEFEKQVVKEREGKNPLLVGELKFSLKRGVGTLGQTYFTDNSSRTRSKKFRLGVKVAQDNDCGLTCIREGKSQAFTVKDIRGIAYMKHGTPSPTDYVWRLRNIGKDGPFHTSLRQEGIHTVKDFLSCKQARPELLRKVLRKMSAKAYKDTIDHAEKCVLGGKMYVYPVNQTPYDTVIFNDHFQTVGAVARGHYVGLDTLNDVQKVRMDSLVKNAYDHWSTNVTEYKTEDLFRMPTLDVDGLPADAVHGTEPTAIEESDAYLGDNAMVAWTSQEQGSGSDNGCSSQNLNLVFSTVADEAINPDNIASFVKDVLREYNEDEEYGVPVDSSPTVNRWWLRIRTVVRCALFIRKAGSARQQQLED